MQVAEKPTLLILAAGLGRRYGGMKQLEQVGPSGETLLDYAAFDASRAGFGHLVFVIGKNMREEFEARVGARFAQQLKVSYAYQDIDDLPDEFPATKERNKPWGTGHATWCARDVIDGPFAVCNADDFYGEDAFRLLADFLMQSESSDGLACAMAGFRLVDVTSENGTVARGICTIEEGLLRTVEETTSIQRNGTGYEGLGALGLPVSLAGEETVSMNVWAFPQEFFSELERGMKTFGETATDLKTDEFYLPAAVDAMIREGRGTVHTYHARGPWMGITYQDDRPLVMSKLRDLAAKGTYPERLWD
ncbi:MAG: nucleotidyltransferase [Opitutae bacterium]|nr:nucleotidyltransferase [Opitutae bacterium]